MGPNEADRGPQVFGLCVHLPGFHVGYLFLSHGRLKLRSTFRRAGRLAYASLETFLELGPTKSSSLSGRHRGTTG